MEEDNPEDIARFDRLARRMGQMDALRSVIGGFLADFALFESMSLTIALRALSHDPTLVEHLPELMDLYNRLKLLKQLGVAYQLPQELQEDISHIRKVANALLECRNDVAHGAAVLTGPFLTDPDAELTPGVQRRRSERLAPKESLTAEQLVAVNREWTHEVPTILKWSEIAAALQSSTHQLAKKLESYRCGAPWQKLVVARVEMPVRAQRRSGR